MCRHVDWSDMFYITFKLINHHFFYQVLGNGELTTKLTVKAGAFSESAKAKLAAAGSTMVDVPGRKKWLSASVQARKARADDYFAKKRASDSWVEK